MHNGYTETAEALVSANEGMVIKESAAAMRNRHSMLKIVFGTASGAWMSVAMGNVDKMESDGWF